MKYFLPLILSLFFLPTPAFAALNCSEFPEDAECLCFLDTGGQPAGPDDTISTVTDTDLECQQLCDNANAVSYQFSECGPNGSVVTQGNTSLANLTTYNPPPASADTTASPPVIPILNVPIPGLDLSQSVVKEGGEVRTNLLSLYVAGVFRYLLIFASVMAVSMLMVGGLEYVVSGGNSKRVERAKKRIRGALIGLVLLFAAYDLAFLLDPRTTAFRSLNLQYIQAVEINNETPAGFTTNFTPATESGSLQLPLYDQTQYSSYAYGPASCNKGGVGNIKSSGCGVTAFAMVASGLSGQSVTPPAVAQSFYQEGFRPIGSDGCGYNGTKYEAFTKSSLLARYGLRGRLIPITDRAQLIDLIRTNHAIITSYATDSGGGHFVVITGMDSKGRLIINNPWGGERVTESVDWWFARIKSATYVDKASQFIE